MSDELHCWRCGSDLSALSLPLSRMDECPACLIYLHVCRMCVYFDPVIARACREDDAEEVKEKERANFCDYFRPSAHAFDSDIAAAESEARTQLGSLFGGKDESDSGAKDAKDDLGDGPAADDLFK
jgi:hypothetical protein